jgi:hypothetical protein
MGRAFSRTACRLGLIALAFGGAALMVPATAAAQPPTCGEVLFHSVTLHADLNCFNQPGLIVGKNGITINLNQFTIRNGNDNFDGVDNSGGFNRVTVENGTIFGFYDGVDYDSTNHGKITGVTSINNGDEGILFENSQNGVITGSQAGSKNNGNVDDGIYLYQNHLVSVLVSVTNTKANWNGGAGITDHTSLDTLDHDTMNHNNQWGVFVYQPLTVNTSTGQKYWTVSNSTANNNNLDGFHVDENAPATLYQANLFGNTAEFNSGWGYFADSSAKSNTTNGAKGNSLGNCFHVKCHALP